MAGQSSLTVWRNDCPRISLKNKTIANATQFKGVLRPRNRLKANKNPTMHGNHYGSSAIKYIKKKAWLPNYPVTPTKSQSDLGLTTLSLKGCRE